MATTNDKGLNVLRVEQDEEDDVLFDTWHVYLSDEDAGPFMRYGRTPILRVLFFLNRRMIHILKPLSLVLDHIRVALKLSRK